MKDIINYFILKQKYNSGLDFRKNIFKRLICKHDYQTYTIPDEINLLCTTRHTQAVVCAKCGKIKEFRTVFY